MAHKGARWTAEELQRHLSKPKEPQKPARNKLPRLSESDLQHQVIQWFAHTYAEIYRTGALIAIPNGGKRGRGAQAQIRKEGVWRGASDLVLFVPKGIYHGAVLEMKAEGGKISSEQFEWLEHRRQSGYHAGIAWTYDEGTRFFDEYLALE